MEIKDQKDPIENDQFGNAENTKEATENPTSEPSEKTEVVEEIQHESTHDEAITETIPAIQGEEMAEPSAEDMPQVVDEIVPQQEVETAQALLAAEEATEINTKAVSNDESIQGEVISQVEETTTNEEPLSFDDEETALLDDEDEESDEDELDEDEDEEGSVKDSETPDYSLLSRDELVEKLTSLLADKPIQKVRSEVDSIKINFYKKHKADYEKKRKEWVEAGGAIGEFVAPEDPLEPQIKELLKQYRDLKAQHNRGLEDQKVKNLEAKKAIIEQIKDLVNRNESVNQTFQEFRELQQKWREVGPVPQAELNDLWETYHHHVQAFYDFIKINKELKDLDLKRNLEEKIQLCEKAEELLLEPSVVNAFKKLQKFHNQWREVGPVPNENRTEIWERFKEVTSSINKRHQEYFESLREEQKVNLEAKTALCEKAEELAAAVVESTKDWNKLSKEMVDLQKVWKSIGFAPKKDNNKIYERFRAACDSFFNSKREFYKDTREEQLNNLQLKTELCMQAEALMESTEWKKTSDELINLQKRWKEIGPVPRKQSDELWKRFRSSCDKFFVRKSEHFSQIDSKYAENLKAKEDLIEEIEKFQVAENVEESLKTLKDFQRRWAEIGFVPIKKKDELQKKYREAINKHFENLKIDNSKKNLLKFKSKIDSIQGNYREENKVRNEREKLFNQLKQLESDIALWENNIGFFARSKNAEQLIKDVENKIEKARADMKMLEEKIRLIDSMDQA